MHAVYTYRNPDANERPAIQDVMMPLQKPDFQILRWESEDASSSAAEATILGALLQDGFHLYEDLQKTYLSTTGAHGELEVNVVGEDVCRTSEGVSESALAVSTTGGELEVNVNGDMLLSKQKTLSYSANDLPGDGSDSIETKPCPAYAPANSETYQDDDYI
jgi:hypothetical protein